MYVAIYVHSKKNLDPRCISKSYAWENVGVAYFNKQVKLSCVRSLLSSVKSQNVSRGKEASRSQDFFRLYFEQPDDTSNIIWSFREAVEYDNHHPSFSISRLLPPGEHRRQPQMLVHTFVCGLCVPPFCPKLSLFWSASSRPTVFGTSHKSYQWQLSLSLFPEWFFRAKLFSPSFFRRDGVGLNAAMVTENVQGKVVASSLSTSSSMAINWWALTMTPWIERMHQPWDDFKFLSPSRLCHWQLEIALFDQISEEIQVRSFDIVCMWFYWVRGNWKVALGEFEPPCSKYVTSTTKTGLGW